MFANFATAVNETKRRREKKTEPLRNKCVILAGISGSLHSVSLDNCETALFSELTVFLQSQFECSVIGSKVFFCLVMTM